MNRFLTIQDNDETILISVHHIVQVKHDKSDNSLLIETIEETHYLAADGGGGELFVDIKEFLVDVDRVSYTICNRPKT